MAYDLQGLYLHIHHQLRTNPTISLATLSDRIRVERHTIEKAVKTATGRTFRGVRNAMLVEHAKVLFDRHPNYTIKEVAFELGYRSQRSFSRFIRANIGCTPKELRRAKPQS